MRARAATTTTTTTNGDCARLPRRARGTKVRAAVASVCRSPPVTLAAAVPQPLLRCKRQLQNLIGFRSTALSLPSSLPTTSDGTTTIVERSNRARATAAATAVTRRPYQSRAHLFVLSFASAWHSQNARQRGAALTTTMPPLTRSLAHTHTIDVVELNRLPVGRHRR